MKYMTFNSSCSYAGVANMLAHHGVDTDDRTIALEMKLPYLFTWENGCYMAGPMLQSAAWFNLYLNPMGFEMTEAEVSAGQIAEHLKQQRTAMLGLRVDAHRKHAVVYTGTSNGKLVFLNNKWAQDPASEALELTETELLDRIGPSVMVATIRQITPRQADISGAMTASISVLQRNLEDINAVCGRKTSVGVLRSMMDPLFRALLLDGVTMLSLLRESELAQRFTAVRQVLLRALQQDAGTVLILEDILPMTELSDAVKEYIQLIRDALSNIS